MLGSRGGLCAECHLWPSKMLPPSPAPMTFNLNFCAPNTAASCLRAVFTSSSLQDLAPWTALLLLLKGSVLLKYKFQPGKNPDSHTKVIEALLRLYRVLQKAWGWGAGNGFKR